MIEKDISYIPVDVIYEDGTRGYYTEKDKNPYIDTIYVKVYRNNGVIDEKEIIRALPKDVIKYKIWKI
jgi:hypothetical protein